MDKHNAGGMDGLFRGQCLVRLSGTEPWLVLNRFTRENIPFRGVMTDEPFSVVFTVEADAVPRAERTARRMGHELTVLRTRGRLRWKSALRRYRVWWLLLLTSAVTAGVCSLFVWDIRVTDNPTAVSDERILRVLEEQGVGVGSFYPLFSEDLIRSRALCELPGLSYLTVNVRGVRAEVTVRPSVEVLELRDEKTPTDIVASYAGIVEKMTVQEGEALVKPGQAVTEGEKLVSSERFSGTDALRYVHARGEITARTYHTVTARMPAFYTQRTARGRKNLCLSLYVGRNRINFYSDSGNPGEKCVIIEKMGSFPASDRSFPVRFVWQVRAEASEELVPVERETAFSAMETAIRAELARRLGEEGETLMSSLTRAEGNGQLYLTLRCECRQRIDREVPLT